MKSIKGLLDFIDLVIKSHKAGHMSGSEGSTAAHPPLLHTLHCCIPSTAAYPPLLHTLHCCIPSTAAHPPLLHTLHCCIPSTAAYLIKWRATSWSDVHGGSSVLYLKRSPMNLSTELCEVSPSSSADLSIEATHLHKTPMKTGCMYQGFI